MVSRSLVADHATKPRNNNILWLLIGLAIGVCITNLTIGGRHAILIRAGNEPSPIELEPFLRQQQQQQHQSGKETPIQRERRRKDRRTKTPENKHSSNRNDDSGKQHVYDGDLTRILKGEKPFPENSNGQQLRLKFRPGTLQLSHAEALQYCFVNTTHYGNHISDRSVSLVSLSDRHRLIYRNIPKSSSSSARHAMQDFLDGGDMRLKHDDMEDKVHNKGYSMISFIRDPLDRFYSSYDEAFFRMGPWMGDSPLVRDKPRVREHYHRVKYKVERYSYLYEGIKNIEDFRLMYCPKELLVNRQQRFLQCNEVPSIDNGTLTHRFERFVQDYSGLDPFDVHLNLQMGNLVFPTGEPFPVTMLYNATAAEKDWQEVARQRGVEIPDGEMEHGRKMSRRFNKGLVANATKRKICRILALDYCCFNMELPKECRGSEDEDDAVSCAMERRNEKTMKHALKPLVIHTWSDPQT